MLVVLKLSAGCHDLRDRLAVSNLFPVLRGVLLLPLSASSRVETEGVVILQDNTALPLPLMKITRARYELSAFPRDVILIF